MGIKSDAYTLKVSWLLIAAFSLFRLIYSGTFLLAPDEANYWQWGRHIAWGYHDQAPMIAWVVNLSTGIFGHWEMSVRLPSVLAMAAASAYAVAIAGRWLGPRTALGTALLTQSMLEFNIGGLLATADGLQAAAWAGASYHSARSFEEDKWPQWMLSGLWFGFGMLSKYTMIIFLPCLLLFALLTPDHRQKLASAKPYAALALGFVMFSPVILWNAANSWNSVRHVMFLGGANQSLSIHWQFFGDYLASQAALLSPLVFVLILLAWVLAFNKPVWRGHWIYRFLCFTSLPMVGGFALLSLHTRIYGNWPGAGFLTASVLAAAFFFAKKDFDGQKMMPLRMGCKLWPWAIGTSYAITFLVLLQVAVPVLPIPARLDRTSTELQGWRELGEKTGNIAAAMPRPEKTFVFGLRYQTASELAFYVSGRPETVSINKWKRPNVYDYWWEDKDLLGWDAVGVTEQPDSHIGKLNQVFTDIEPPIKLAIYRDAFWQNSGKALSDKKPVKVYYLYRAFGFKGGLRWDPPDPSDIRAATR